jgi:hypothetical protein
MVAMLSAGWRFAAALLLLAMITIGSAQARTALVIGNSDYPKSPLSNPKNDAADLAAALREAGFDVDLKLDADRRTMQQAIESFGNRLKSKPGVGLFYFAGHGAQLSGENYLLPVDSGFADANEMKRSAVSASEAVDAMAKSHAGLNIVILDACRDNPFPAAAGSRGLTRIDTNASLFLSYSTSPGAVALGGDGRNSPYTKHLVNSVRTAGLSIEDTFKQTLKGVYQETQGQQTPWLSSSFFGDFVFRPRGGNLAAVTPVPAPPVAPDAAQKHLAGLAGIYRDFGTNPNGSKYFGMATVVPRGAKAQFTWWITKDKFAGAAELAGKMLIVNWNAKHPVVYTFKDGVLEGEWADGKATDRLELFAPLESAPAPAPSGKYRIEGMNPNGKPYSGTLTVTSRGPQYQFAWQTGPTSYKGTGTREGNVMIVNWGSTMPMLYSLNPDGTMSGLWDAGRGNEIATPSQ